MLRHMGYQAIVAMSYLQRWAQLFAVFDDCRVSCRQHRFDCQFPSDVLADPAVAVDPLELRRQPNRPLRVSSVETQTVLGLCGLVEVWLGH